ncbi:MAG: hypothetical protein Q4G60_12680, partial [bacterium]|nr:hypothetical protein [bacterium]
MNVKMDDLLKAIKANEVLNAVKANDFLKKKQEEEEEKSCCNTWKWIIGIVLGVALIAGIAYALYCYFTPDYLEDFEDDLDDDFND